MSTTLKMAFRGSFTWKRMRFMPASMALNNQRNDLLNAEDSELVKTALREYEQEKEV